MIEYPSKKNILDANLSVNLTKLLSRWDQGMSPECWITRAVNHSNNDRTQMQRQRKSSVLIKFSKSSEDPEKGQKQVLPKIQNENKKKEKKEKSKQTSTGECAKHSKVYKVPKLHKAKHSAHQTKNR